jgi:hypothetical protein
MPTTFVSVIELERPDRDWPVSYEQPGLSVRDSPGAAL